MIATWFGGPYDGRTDELPYGTAAVSVAHPTEWNPHVDAMDQWPSGFVEVRCRLDYRNKGWVIVWHEPNV